MPKPVQQEDTGFHQEIHSPLGVFFPVALRLWPQTFVQSPWQKEADPDLAAYLHFYGLASGAGVKAGWLDVEGGLRCWLQAFAPASTAPASGTLLHLHGYYDHGALYPHYQRWALDQSLHYVTVDLPGHGLSSGPRASIDDFATYQQLLDAAVAALQAGDFPRPWLLSGFSTGGAIALQSWLKGSAFDRLALLAPLVRPCGWPAIRRWLPWLALIVRQLPRQFRANSHDTAFLHFVRDEDPLQPRRLPLLWVKALARWIPQIEKAQAEPGAMAKKSWVDGSSVVIIQGDEDTTVDGPYNLKFLQQLLPEARVARLPGGAHQLLNEDKKRRDQLFAFLEQELFAD